MSEHAVTLSIVVPTLNEAGNVALLLQRIAANLQPAGIAYDVLFIDDHSTDGTVETIKSLAGTYPVSVSLKHGRRGKAYSILQGIDEARGELICMIDADLQYPPEAISAMVKYITDNKADVVLSQRVTHNTSPLRQLSSKVYNFFFTKLLFGIDYDTQSGLKVFRREIMQDMQLHPSPWSFDLEFIVECLLRGYRVVSHEVEFASRHSGKAKLSVFTATLELIKATLQLWIRVPRGQVRAGFARNRQRAIHHNISSETTA
ncbi:glycosyltransferase family 2 protein [Candidatus Saccharibacteria bacterium]|nr:glycosyltransferase family 2 protein [Candidatus Saccharibacteria bacterium]